MCVLDTVTAFLFLYIGMSLLAKYSFDNAVFVERFKFTRNTVKINLIINYIGILLYIVSITVLKFRIHI